MLTLRRTFDFRPWRRDFGLDKGFVELEISKTTLAIGHGYREISFLMYGAMRVNALSFSAEVANADRSS